MNIEQFCIQHIEPLRQASLSRPHPNFFIVGAAKSGTTSLWAYLKQHPEIAVPSEHKYKEPSFFSAHYRFRPDIETYLGLFAEANEKKAIGEASTTYLSSPESAEFIHAIYPDAKIIMMLRNPVERAFSLYQWMIREGYEWLYPFEKALSAEEDRMKNEQFEFHNPQYYYNYLYYYSGLYSEQILRYIERFPKEHIKFFLFDDLKQHAVQTVQELYKFLNVDANFVPQIKVHNKAQTPLWATGQYFFRFGMSKKLKHYHISKPIRKWLTQRALALNLSLGRLSARKLHPATRRELLHRYQYDIRKTSQLIGRNLESWMILM